MNANAGYLDEISPLKLGRRIALITLGLLAGLVPVALLVSSIVVQAQVASETLHPALSSVDDGYNGLTIALFTVGALASALNVLCVCASVVALCVGLVRRRPFARPILAILTITAWCLILGGAISFIGLNTIFINGAFAFEPKVFEPWLPIGLLLALFVGAFRLAREHSIDTAGLV
jgi:hypothetical protein